MTNSFIFIFFKMFAFVGKSKLIFIVQAYKMI